MAFRIPHIPENPPRFGGRFMRGLGRLGLRTLGWRVEGSVPNISKAVFVGAPHTSNWDFILSMLCIMAMGIKISYLMKREAFFWPFKAWFLYLGGVPIDRSETSDIVPQLIVWLRSQNKAWIAITPEGTRSEVSRWKTGFARIAWEAKIPIVLVAWDFPSKTMYIGKTWQPTGDVNADVDAIKDYVSARYSGRNVKI